MREEDPWWGVHAKIDCALTGAATRIASSRQRAYVGWTSRLNAARRIMRPELEGIAFTP